MKVYITKVSSPNQLKAQLREALEWLGWQEIIQREARVFVKPNLTWRVPVPGVTTSPEFIEAVVSILKERSGRITIGEADGGYHSYVAEEAFQSHGLTDLAKRYDVQLLNLSKEPVEVRTVVLAGKPVDVELPRTLLSQTDVFITLPVPKVHAMTGVSLAFKNQWGCQPGTMRLRNHPDFVRKIIAINRLLKPRLALFDGKYFLDKTGPMIGKAVRMDLLLAADSAGAGDLACCELMGIDPRRIRHFRLAQQVGMMPSSLEEIKTNQDIVPLRTHRFRLERTLINWIALTAFHSRIGTRLFYDSPLAGPFHTVLYAIRRNPLVSRILYGSVGPPTVEGRRR